ncbi:hypothetical protein [Okeania sp. SIO1I7]|nr:hypothetical protein [Okeania sp. SIO1I7]
MLLTPQLSSHIMSGSIGIVSAKVRKKEEGRGKREEGREKREEDY